MRVLTVKLADLGDVLTATPALRALRIARPADHLAALVPPHSAAVLRGTDLVDDVITFPKALFDKPWNAVNLDALRQSMILLSELRDRRFDAIALFHHLTTRFGAAKYALLCAAAGAPTRAGLDNGRGIFLTHRVKDDGFGAMHEVQYAFAVAGLLGAQGEPGPLEVPISSEAMDWAAGKLPTGGELIALHPGSGEFSRARRWPIAAFTALARALQDRGARVVLVGGPEEVGLTRTVSANLPAPCIDLAGRTSVSQLAAVLARCRLLIANDGGVMHLATAVSTPVVALFGPSNHRAWGPWTAGRSYADVVRLELACSPCFYVGDGLGLREGCLPRPCLRELSPTLVLAAAQRALDCNG